MNLDRFELELDDQAYLDEIAALSFEGVAWDRERIRVVRDLFGHWDHNIHLGHGIYTARCADYFRAHEEIMKLVSQCLSGDFGGKRILDLGCLEGYFSAECAMQGADVVGVEGRLINIKKCEFVKSVLDIDNFRIVRDDAMAVTRERYDSFDVVLALGLLYHLDDPFTFLHHMSALCDGSLLIDTHVALDVLPQSIGEGWKPELSAPREFTYRGQTYVGRLYREFEIDATQLEKDLSPTASLENELSVWLTEDSLVQLLRDVGFEQVQKLAYGEREPIWWGDEKRDVRVLLLAVKERSEFRSRIFARDPLHSSAEVAEVSSY
jgi:2-polyprenyl-3-methyl-5-hydroxy-6-metoxy-1,4-benzoquinol methylase